NGTTIAVTTAANGSYSFTGVAPGTYTVTPNEPGINFTPTSLSVTVSEGPVTVSAFNAAATYTVSGTITPASLGNGATVTLSQNGTTIAVTTAASGRYSFTGVAPGTYTVTPDEPGINFTPTSRGVTVSRGPVTVSTFRATILRRRAF
ncbi:MAG: carboxypeptidase regulatory-like domain-containing protein, partial [Syntrophorhabdales bacterium]